MNMWHVDMMEIYTYGLLYILAFEHVDMVDMWPEYDAQDELHLNIL